MRKRHVEHPHRVSAASQRRGHDLVPFSKVSIGDLILHP